jgi:hypothetical protein
MSNRKKPWSRPRLAPGHVRVQTAHAYGTGSVRLPVPAAVARMIGPEAVFQVELTEEGILYRYVQGANPLVKQLPAWMVEG